MISGRHDLLLGLLLYFGLDSEVSFGPASGSSKEERDRDQYQSYMVDAVAVLTNALMRATESDRTRTLAGKSSVREKDSF